jgi:hypothetical protein
MDTVTELNLDNITIGEAKLTLDKVIKQIAQQTGEILIARDDVEIIAYALENNLTLRDYLMGLTRDGLSVESVTNILRVLMVLIEQAELPAYPIRTVLARYMYELGDSDALIMLNAGLNKGYSLAQLLRDVMNRELPPSVFANMANELHHKVVAELTRTSELYISETN